MILKLSEEKSLPGRLKCGWPGQAIQYGPAHRVEISADFVSELLKLERGKKERMCSVN
jgi:hypothetical protein